MALAALRLHLGERCVDAGEIGVGGGILVGLGEVVLRKADYRVGKV